MSLLKLFLSVGAGIVRIEITFKSSQYVSIFVHLQRLLDLSNVIEQSVDNFKRNKLNNSSSRPKQNEQLYRRR